MGKFADIDIVQFSVEIACSQVAPVLLFRLWGSQLADDDLYLFTYKRFYPLAKLNDIRFETRSDRNGIHHRKIYDSLKLRKTG